MRLATGKQVKLDCRGKVSLNITLANKRVGCTSKSALEVMCSIYLLQSTSLSSSSSLLPLSNPKFNQNVFLDLSDHYLPMQFFFLLFNTSLAIIISLVRISLYIP